MFALVRHVQDVIQGKNTVFGVARSGKWVTVRKHHLEQFPTCTVCGGTKNINVHHIQPFHLQPELELEPTNLLTLCEGNPNLNCHLVIGHSFNFKGYNPDVIKDAQELAKKKSTNEARIKKV
jgi:5-methylcytosine-specific restriction protein A